MKAGCEIYLKILLIEGEASQNVTIATFTHIRDYGGLLYPSGNLLRFVQELERLFTTCFSLLELHADSILDVIALAKAMPYRQLGCAQHCEQLSAEIIPFYVTTRLHFLTRALNKDNDKKHEASKHIKLSLCT